MANSEPWRSYKERVAGLAQRVVDGQRPIQILNSIKWPASAFEEARAQGFRELPQIEAQSHSATELGFEPEERIRWFDELGRDVERELGENDPVGGILQETAREYVTVVQMLEARGTKRFYELSKVLYGSAKDTFADGTTRVRDVAHDMYEILTQIDDSVLGPQPPRDVSADKVVEILDARFTRVFGPGTVRVILDDGIVADAAAGADYVKVRRGAAFSERDIRILEVHEGWAHVSTSLNGQQQPVARWLSKGPPRTAATQEGLASLLEVLTLASYPSRARRLNDRVLAVDKAEDGASFLEVFEWFRTEGYDEHTCFWNTHRIFRGGMLSGGAPFTKDIVYTKGIVSNFNFLRSAIASGRPELIRLLFLGKVALEDIPILANHLHDGVVHAPHHVPEIFSDLNGLSIWLGITTFWGRLDHGAIFDHYERLFQQG